MESSGGRIGSTHIRVHKYRNEHTFYSEFSINIGGNIGPIITASLTIQSLTMMITQIDYGELCCSYWLTTHHGR